MPYPVQLILVPYTPEKYDEGILEYNHRDKTVGEFIGFVGEHDKAKYISNDAFKSFVKPYLVSNDEPFPNDLVFSSVTNTIMTFTDPRHFSAGTTKKVVATPEQIINCYINLGEHDFGLRNVVLPALKCITTYEMTEIMKNNGKCFIDMEYKTMEGRDDEGYTHSFPTGLPKYHHEKIIIRYEK